MITEFVACMIITGALAIFGARLIHFVFFHR
jgi:hypothetical protein